MDVVVTMQADVAYDLIGGPQDGDVVYLPIRAKWYVHFGGYRHSVYVAESHGSRRLTYRGTAANREEAERLADDDSR